MPGRSRSIGRRGGLTLALVTVVAGAALLLVAVAAQRNAPEPRSAGQIDPSPATRNPASPGTASPPPLGPSAPVTVTIPAIGVHTRVFPIGLAADGTLAVPQPGPRLDTAAWFENSPTPGQPGPSIIEGHVDSAQGPSVFFRLGDLHPRDLIHVRRSDGTRLTFRIDAIRDFKKSRFPTALVYGGRQLSQPTLRLITCSDFDATIRHHVGNEVVFAHLTHVSGRGGTS